MIVFTFRGRPIFARGKAMVAYRIIYSNKMKESIHIQNFGPLRDVRIGSPQ